MEKKCGILVVKRLHFFNILDFIWTLHLKNIFDCGWTWTEFLKIRTGSGLQNMTVRSPVLGGSSFNSCCKIRFDSCCCFYCHLYCEVYIQLSIAIICHLVFHKH